MYRTCECGTSVNLQGDNIGLKIIYESSCPNCGKWLTVVVDAKTGNILKDVD